MWPPPYFRANPEFFVQPEQEPESDPAIDIDAMSGFNVFKGPGSWAKVISSADVTPVHEAFVNHGVSVSDVHSCAITVYGDTSIERIPVPEVLCNSSDGCDVLARFYVTAGLLALSYEQFAKAGYGDKRRYERWWTATFRPFSNAVLRAVGGDSHIALASAGAGALGHLETDLPQDVAPAKTPPAKEPKCERTTSVCAIALALGANTYGRDTVILGTEGEHRAIFPAYYINLDRLEGDTKEARMVDALRQLARLGCLDAREACIQIAGRRERPGASVERGR